MVLMNVEMFQLSLYFLVVFLAVREVKKRFYSVKTFDLSLLISLLN